MCRPACATSFSVPAAEQQPDLVSLFVPPLNRLGLVYAVTGAVASIVYGEPRLTTDIDILIALSDVDAPRISAAFAGGAFYVPPTEVIEMEVRRPLHGHFNLIHLGTSLKADVYPAGEDPLHTWALGLRRAIALSGETVSVAPPEYVIVRKLQYFRDGGSDKHLRDVRSILRTMGDSIDREVLLPELRRLGLDTEWEQVARRAK